MLGSVVRERVFDNSNNFNQRILGLLPETARSMLPFSFESENRTVRGILSTQSLQVRRAETLFILHFQRITALEERSWNLPGIPPLKP